LDPALKFSIQFLKVKNLRLYGAPVRQQLLHVRGLLVVWRRRLLLLCGSERGVSLAKGGGVEAYNLVLQAWR